MLNLFSFKYFEDGGFFSKGNKSFTKNFNDFSFRNLFYNYIKFLKEYENSHINSDINIKNQMNITKNLNDK